MTIGGWDNSTDGPLVLALSASGHLVSIIAINPSQFDSLDETVTSIDEWLATMQLRDLSELSGNHVEFYEGLWDLRPDSSISLSPVRRYVLLTAIDRVDTSNLVATLPNAEFTVGYLDVLQAPEAPLIIRRRAVSRLATVVDIPKQVDTPGAEAFAPDVPEATDIIETPEDFGISENDDLGEPTPFLSAAVLAIEAELEGDLELDVHPELEVEVESEIEVEHDVADEPNAAELLFGHQTSHSVDEAEVLQAINEMNEPAKIDFAPLDLPRVHIAPAAPVPDDIEPLEPAVAEDADDVAPDEPAVVDLTTAEHNPVISLDVLAVETEPMPVESGTTFLLDELPLIFDPTGATLESISDELFAARGNIVIVARLPERRRDSPFEDRNRFRWDTSLSRIQLLNEHSFNPEGTRRTVQLFVESDREPGYATYVGVLSRIAFQTQTHTHSETAWFSIEPRLEADLFRTLRKGRMPQYQKGRGIRRSGSRQSPLQ